MFVTSRNEIKYILYSIFLILIYREIDAKVELKKTFERAYWKVNLFFKLGKVVYDYYMFFKV